MTRKSESNSSLLNCPICGDHISKSTIKLHFTHHWNNANSNKIESKSDWIVENRKMNRRAAMVAMKKFSSKKDFLEDDNERLLSRVKSNRISRTNILREKTKRKNKKNEIDNLINEYNNSINPSTCFMCGAVLIGSLEQINLHIDQCLQQQNVMVEEPSVLLNKSGSFDEYTWAGQTRIRATSLHEGSISDIASNPVNHSRVDDDTDVELNIEDDETEIYGQKQYGEHSILKVKQENENEKEKNIERNQNTPPKKKSSIIRIPIPKNLIKNSQKENKEQNNNKQETIKKQDEIEEKKNDKNLIIDALRAKIKEMEKQHTESSKCLICLEPFVNPVTSINCWHVFCEKCWLQTLGAKRLCPQCQIITSPGDLRRIYL
ncbi:hypothetical protein BCR36DRAFT_360052 [Piromyces finnis]|uniref:RING-type domain-containing protein n=1 Tax=Piromyces finnis TaxID=1754191 RepID=A0A1Y1V111_9FUNG|nr:hypothetical protein BCR36DRAFT_360052 [Piromyces finnis]|eukprot:ORX44139.1 hypothetical protein BCR36DRAFT_360052 [Piromyces finnis]